MSSATLFEHVPAPRRKGSLLAGKKSLGCRPFVKWAGGKGKLLSVLSSKINQLPNKFQTYFEPFVGGGALFFHLLPRHAVLADVNPELVNTYRVVRDKVHELIESLEQHEYSEDYYYKVRDADRGEGLQSWSDVERASRFIYLNKTCYNGLYRVNSRGEFNVPFGDYKNPVIADRENLLACSKALENTEVVCSSFDEVMKRTKRDDFVYFDPPYAPISKTANFSAYHRGGFGAEDQKRLSDLCLSLNERGVYFVLSNSASDVILGLYEGFQLATVEAPRSINSRADRRGRIHELLVSNY